MRQLCNALPAVWLPLLIVLSAITGCSSATPVTRYYLLSNPEQMSSDRTPQGSSCSLSLRSVTVAPYLQRTHIMLQSGSNELVPAMQHRWSEPMEAGVSRLLAYCLGGGEQATHRASVRIDHLHGDTTGRVVLQAHWSLSGEQDALSPFVPREAQFSAAAAQPSAGYDALVSTQRELVLQLCADIKAAVPACN